MITERVDKQTFSYLVGLVSVQRQTWTYQWIKDAAISSQSISKSKRQAMLTFIAFPPAASSHVSRPWTATECAPQNFKTRGEEFSPSPWRARNNGEEEKKYISLDDLAKKYAPYRAALTFLRLFDQTRFFQIWEDNKDYKNLTWRTCKSRKLSLLHSDLHSNHLLYRFWPLDIKISLHSKTE